ncbi:hypothetical protein ACQPZJ_01735 [Actinoplanes sp. CA-054009]
MEDEMAATGYVSTHAPSGGEGGPHTHTIAQVSGLQDALDEKQPIGNYANSSALATVAAEVASHADRIGVLENEPAPEGGTVLLVSRGTVESGNIVPQATTGGAWEAVTGGPVLSIAAEVGDYVSFDIVSWLRKTASAYMDLAVIVGGGLRRFLATGDATPAPEGAPGLYGDLSFRTYGTIFEFFVEATDLTGDRVNVVIATKGAGNGTIYADATYPMRWRAINYGGHVQ